MPRNRKSKRNDAAGSKENESAKSAANLNESASSAANLNKSAKSAANLNESASSAANLNESAKSAANLNKSASSAANLNESAKSAANLNESAKSAANLNESAKSAAIREKLKMITKTFEPKEMLPFGQLRTLNQKDLLQSLDENDKLGIVIKDQLKVAMIDMEKYQIMVDAVQEYKRLLELLDERELFERTAHRLDSDRWEELPEGMSLMDWAGIIPKG
jgi:hypothetical protein